jgi:hypothetical protein
MTAKSDNDALVWGADDIGVEINATARKVYHLLRAGSP